MEVDCQNASALGLEKYPRDNASKQFEYGTAGFRDKSTELPHVMYRMGLLAVLRSKAKTGLTVGLMITASHNPEEDNGVKLCDPDGDMIVKEWEVLATKLVNSKNEELNDTLIDILNSNEIDYDVPASVYLASDTRKSSPSLSNAALDGIKVLNGLVKDFGILTTPQLHFVVCCKNNPSYGVPTLQGYYEKYCLAFENLMTLTQKESTKYKSHVFVDGANGVGAHKLIEIRRHLCSLFIDVFNDGTNGVLNFQCGADHVKVEQKPPQGNIVENRRYASVDGDADRLIYFYVDDESTFHLLDGDKIATLVAKYLKEVVQETGLDLEMRVIQTAYANGQSTNYIQNTLEIPVICVPTGVKHLHHEAKKYDIGIYFEANGHGTVVFSDKVKKQIQIMLRSVKYTNTDQLMTEKLLHTVDLINETVGDAISDLLLVEAILHDYDWSIEDWDALYTDYPNRQLKVKVPDRRAISTTDAERKCVKPDGLQSAIDTAVSKYENSRAFVRPSGTEDVVRVYAEADTQENADALAEEISTLVVKFTSGD